MENYKARFEVETLEKWKEISNKIPSLNFESEWNVKIIPPFAGALTRFVVQHNNITVSVYLDWFDRLGFMREPYWEIYNFNEEPYRFLLNDTKKMMEKIKEMFHMKQFKENTK